MQTIKKKREDVSQYSDPALVTLARSGDGAAFAAIMTRYNQRLYRVARGIVRDESEAEDVLQEAYVRAFAALSGFRGDSGLGTWLTRIVLNEAFGRMRQRRPTVELEAIDKAVETGDSRVIMFPGAELRAESGSRGRPLGGAAPARARHRRSAGGVPPRFRDARNRRAEHRRDGGEPGHSPRDGEDQAPPRTQAVAEEPR